MYCSNPGISDRRMYRDYLVAWISYGISDGLTIDHVHVDTRSLRHGRNATVVSGVTGLRMRDPQSAAQKVISFIATLYMERVHYNAYLIYVTVIKSVTVNAI